MFWTNAALTTVRVCKVRAMRKRNLEVQTTFFMAASFAGAFLVTGCVESIDGAAPNQATGGSGGTSGSGSAGRAGSSSTASGSGTASGGRSGTPAARRALAVRRAPVPRRALAVRWAPARPARARAPRVRRWAPAERQSVATERRPA